ncbi:cohesin domain-containing protein [Methanosarcina sp. MTP4]|uniref:cohesin domain-containing protein n=1 Tax=Methanosarcina sp. MTP4 TaxID=1434100 RepID=UPI0009E2CA48|nr:cohesin domain-containing protein [Methanosarcina sp. MTP4]
MRQMNPMKMLLFGAALLCFISPACAASLTVSIADAGAAPGNTVMIPIKLQGADNIGSMDIVLAYDSSVLQATGVEAGDLGKNAFIESGTKTPGKVVIALADASGINGDGSVVLVSFLMKGEAGSSSPLTFEEVSVHNLDLVEVLPTVRGGSLAVSETSPAGGYADSCLLLLAVLGLATFVTR